MSEFEIAADTARRMLETHGKDAHEAMAVALTIAANRVFPVGFRGKVHVSIDKPRIQPEDWTLETRMIQRNRKM